MIESLSKKSFSLGIFIITFSILCFFICRAYPQALNISGLLEVDYTSTITTSKIEREKTKSKTSDLLQRYILSGAGVIIDPRLASYSASIGVTDSTYKNVPAEGDSVKVGTNTLTYTLNLGIFPTRTPLNIFAQRNIIAVENAPDLISNTYSIGWAANIRMNTTLRTTFLQIGTKYKDSTSPRDTRVRIANITITRRLSRGSISGNYQYTDYLLTSDSDKISSKVNSYSIRGENRLTPSLFISGTVTYFPKGSFFAPGITTTSETTGEINLLHRLSRFSQSGNYTFRKTPGGEIERDTLTYNMNYRPLSKTDYRADVLYSSTGTEQTDTKEYRFAGGLNHRPFYGLSITTDIIVHHFDVTGKTGSISGSRTDRMGILTGVNYFKLFELVNFNSSYIVDYSTTSSNQQDADGSILTHTATFALQTRTLQATQVLGSYTLLLRENTIVSSDDRQEQTVRMEVNSSYFNKWLLNGSITYSSVLDYGDTFILDTRVEYFPFIRTSFAGGYRLNNYPSATNTQDSQLYYLEGQHYRYITRRLNINITARGEKEDLQYTVRDRFLLTSTLTYRIGKIFINFEFREDYTRYPESMYNTQSYFVRASRPF